MLIKILLILAILILLSGVGLSAAYLKLRPYIRAVRQFFKSFREMGELDRQDENAPLKGQSQRSDGKLIRCASCGIWTPENRVVKLRGNIAYCSHDCLENAAEPQRQKKRSSL